MGKVAKIPVIMQMEELECGAASLAMILASFGRWEPLEQVRVSCGVSRDGSNAKNILQAARNYGLKADADRLEAEEIRQMGLTPCIIHWEFRHFAWSWTRDGSQRKEHTMSSLRGVACSQNWWNGSASEFDILTITVKPETGNDNRTIS